MPDARTRLAEKFKLFLGGYRSLDRRLWAL